MKLVAVLSNLGLDWRRRLDTVGGLGWRRSGRANRGLPTTDGNTDPIVNHERLARGSNTWIPRIEVRKGRL